MGDPSTAVPSRFVFVYGTLRRGDVRDITRLSPAPRFVGMASVPGVLYHLGRYPGVILGGAGRVLGEVYAIDPALEYQLDIIEGVLPQPNDEYFKREVAVSLSEGHSPETPVLSCLMYEINPAHTAGRPVIASGDWLQGRDLFSCD
ncbi:gamma-glutamylcyclotransferase family protein [Polaromonas sp. SM01]|uniref:gamma-glutamylcyclotransferase family protein n=1 Tax=Polaromonas sp. SM01 TaxID=3085630 RepID=UPI002982B5D9|nr:gamma-glutamylcyclotransferase family protein [Polaromonas sp. SM01]MDW5443101.1 gamma-glutamylcyclotransferase family protein [Polaromonas sp. SM01]